MPFIEAIGLATAPSAISWRRAGLPAHRACVAHQTGAALRFGETLEFSVVAEHSSLRRGGVCVELTLWPTNERSRPGLLGGRWSADVHFRRRAEKQLNIEHEIRMDPVNSSRPTNPSNRKFPTSKPAICELFRIVRGFCCCVVGILWSEEFLRLPLHPGWMDLCSRDPHSTDSAMNVFPPRLFLVRLIVRSVSLCSPVNLLRLYATKKIYVYHLHSKNSHKS